MLLQNLEEDLFLLSDRLDSLNVMFIPKDIYFKMQSREHLPN